ncbi:MAG: T9SS type A sorting domain-containing protein [Sphingomonadales bacterium]
MKNILFILSLFLLTPVMGKQHHLIKLNASYTWGDGNADFVKIRILYFEKGKMAAYDSLILRNTAQLAWRRGFDGTPDSMVFQVVDHSKRIPLQNTFAKAGQFEHCSVINFDKLLNNANCASFPMNELGTLCVSVNVSVYDDMASNMPIRSGAGENNFYCENEAKTFTLSAPCYMKFRTAGAVLQWYESQSSQGPWQPIDTGWVCYPFAGMKRNRLPLFNQQRFYKLVSDTFTVTGVKNLATAVFGPVGYYVGASIDSVSVYGKNCLETAKRIDVTLSADTVHQHISGVNVWLKNLKDPSPGGMWFLGNEKNITKINISRVVGQFHPLASQNAGKVLNLVNGAYAVGIDFTPWNDFDCGFRWDTVLVDGPYGFDIETRMLRGESCPGAGDGKWTFTAKSALWDDTLQLNVPGLGVYKPGDTLLGLSRGEFVFEIDNAGGCAIIGKFSIPGLPFFGKKLGIDTVLCNGQWLKIDARDAFATGFEAVKPDGTRILSDTFTAVSAGKWPLKWTNDSGCVVRDTIQIQRRNLSVIHDFLLPAQVKLNDTAWAVDHSRPKPASSLWTLQGPAWQKAQNETLKFLIKDTGLYPITLASKFDSGCTYRRTKWLQIVRPSDTSRFITQMGYQGPLIKSFILKPNPSTGLKYQADIVFRNTTDPILTLLDPVSGHALRRKEYKQVQQISERPFDIEKEGVYFIRVVAGNEIQTRKILIIQ